MKKIHFLFVLFLAAYSGRAQTPYIGHAVFTFNDSTRSGGFGSGGGPGRQIQCEIYYPSTSATGGDTVPITAGQYPVLVFGHGFVMAWSSYDNIWVDLVPQGYVMAFLRTEGSLSPSHADFGKDLALVTDRMLKEGNNPTCFLFNHLSNTSAIMGHSMGGGSAFLACENNTNVTTLVTLAAANTNPSSIAAAANISIPTLIIAGQNDCVAPPTNHQDSMYFNTWAACKAQVTIKGAGHCGFANYNFNCAFGEGSCSPQPTITPAQQQSVTSLYYSTWLAWFLKNDCNAWNTFNDSLAFSNTVTGIKSCSITCSSSLNEIVSTDNFVIFPNPAENDFTISSGAVSQKTPFALEIYDGPGRLVKKIEIAYPGCSVNISALDKGAYIIRVYTNQRPFEKILIKY